MQATVRQLIAAAAKTHGSKASVARNLGVTRQRLYEWETGLRQIPMSALARLALTAGANVEQTIAQAAIARYKRHGCANCAHRVCSACIHEKRPAKAGHR